MPAKENKKVGKKGSEGALQTRAQKFSVYLSKKTWRLNLDLCAVKCKNRGWASQLLGFSLDSILGDLILVLRSKSFNYLRETLYKHAMEHVLPGRGSFRKKKTKINHFVLPMFLFL